MVGDGSLAGSAKRGHVSARFGEHDDTVPWLHAMNDVSRWPRRLALLDALATRSSQARTEAEVVATVAAGLEQADGDVPFALVYLVGQGDSSARLAAAVGLEPSHPAAVGVIDLADTSAIWPLQQAMCGELAAPLPAGPWPEKSKTALLLPLRRSDDDGDGCFGFLVAGEGPETPVDGGYRTFLRLVCSQFATLLAGAELRTKLERTAHAGGSRPARQGRVHGDARARAP